MNEDFITERQTNQKQETRCVNCPSTTTTSVPTIVQEEINRIKEVAKIYTELQTLMPGYKSEYMSAFVEFADRFDTINV